MTEDSSEGVCVIIAAKDAAGTIGKAIRSALAETAVREVVVVDDGSADGTADAAHRADDGTERLRVARFEQNRGPSAARNHAIDISTAPLIGILDADDFFFPGRFAPMQAEADWDLIADNIGFIHHDPAQPVEPERFEARTRLLTLVDFVEGNISRRGRPRGEIGFLKPVMRRSFLTAHGLRYDESLRLGEDYDLYLRALARGARYKVIDHCGYGAVVRANSLSGRHRTEDLRRLHEAERRLRLMPGLLTEEQARVVKRHEDHIRARHDLRHILDIKAKGGAVAALGHLLAHPRTAPAVLSGVLRDKLDAVGGKHQAQPPVPAGKLRYLLPGVPVSQQ